MNILNRYYQPKDAKDAMRYIEKLFNRYRNEPLTQELLAYHQKLISQIATNIIPVAKQEHNQQRIKAAQEMETIMQQWIRAKLMGQPFNGRMHHFQFEPDNQRIKFKRHHVKVKGNSNLRSSRH
ncbi:hypothetical protein MOO44_04950 [Nicoliella spurrieriana]|uniref:Uncharacterized protein n=1 Tax=Nicoliella spurrieriana TaxID=2925830 RepID=A0A976RR60_9LACO|nr:hypothetical protein [Nicoliella spurrieriana]UQS86274.1 hypothetical protein MOO44_04950 [Nicoliella spurrieriana]